MQGILGTKTDLFHQNGFLSEIIFLKKMEGGFLAWKKAKLLNMNKKHM